VGGSVFASLVAEEDVDFLLDPVLVVGQVSLRVLLVNQARKVAQLIDEVEQLTDIIGDLWGRGVQSLEMLLIDLAHTLHAIVDRFIV